MVSPGHKLLVTSPGLVDSSFQVPLGGYSRAESKPHFVI